MEGEQENPAHLSDSHLVQNYVMQPHGTGCKHPALPILLIGVGVGQMQRGHYGVVGQHRERLKTTALVA